jgi:hypothetical protein
MSSHPENFTIGLVLFQNVSVGFQLSLLAFKDPNFGFLCLIAMHICYQEAIISLLFLIFHDRFKNLGSGW